MTTDETNSGALHGNLSSPALSGERENASSAQELAVRLAVLESVLSHVKQGISLFDCDLNLEVCNPQYLEMLKFPAELGVRGTPFETFIRYNALRGEYDRK